MITDFEKALEGHIHEIKADIRQIATKMDNFVTIQECQGSRDRNDSSHKWFVSWIFGLYSIIITVILAYKV